MLQHWAAHLCTSRSLLQTQGEVCKTGTVPQWKGTGFGLFCSCKATDKFANIQKASSTVHLGRRQKKPSNKTSSPLQSNEQPRNVCSQLKACTFQQYTSIFLHAASQQHQLCCMYWEGGCGRGGRAPSPNHLHDNDRMICVPLSTSHIHSHGLLHGERPLGSTYSCWRSFPCCAVTLESPQSGGKTPLCATKQRTEALSPCVKSTFLSHS